MIVLILTACNSVECGTGTNLNNGFCEAIDSNTEVTSLECGPGTIEDNGVCIPEAPNDCGQGTILRGDECISAELQHISIPFPEGMSISLSQGHHGYFSHQGSSMYAIDIPVEEGTEITAARAGKVWRLYEDSDSGCGEASCSDQANYIVVDHGDGSFGKYWHLQQYGALVALGDDVAQGQVIGLSGNTGWSTGPHLHFEVSDIFYQSLPLFIDEFADHSDGVPFPGIEITSANTEQTLSNPLDYSDCPSNLFQFLGVTLDPGTPCSVAKPNVEYTVSGRVASDSNLMIVNQHIDGDWVGNCTASDTSGNFSTSLSWDGTDPDSYLIISAAEGDCYTYTGWAYSPRIMVRTY